jgi:predicted nucleic acid-binding protein
MRSNAWRSGAVQKAEAVHVPAIAMGEPYYGASKSTRVVRNVTRVDALAARRAVLACDATTARAYGGIKALLRSGSQRSPRNTASPWPAATSTSTSCPASCVRPGPNIRRDSPPERARRGFGEHLTIKN